MDVAYIYTESITADFNLFLLCQPSFNVPILLLWVVKTYSTSICCLNNQCVKYANLFQSKIFLLMNLFSGMYFFNTYLAWTLSVRIHTLSLLLSAQIIHGYIKINITQFSVKAGNLT